MKNNKYLRFLNQNYNFIDINTVPEVTKEQLEKLYIEIENIFVVLVLIEKNCKNEIKIDFIEVITNHLMGLLLNIPNNFYPSINFCFRGVIEGSIKFIYQNKIEKDQNYENVSKIGYRNLKEKLKKQIKEEYLNTLYSLYSEYSDDLHIKNKNKIDISDSINEIIKKLDYNYEKLIKDLRLLFESFMKFLNIEFKVNENNFPLEDRKYLKKKLSNSKYKKVMNIKY